jgi:cysteine desulfurase/selenocysteine lyase
LEHHSNILPWQVLCEQTGAHLRVIPVTDAGELRMDDDEHLLTPRTRLIAISHVSNALGTINPVSEIVRLAHERGIPVLVDGAQAVAHMGVDVQALGCDFYVFSGHKVFGPIDALVTSLRTVNTVFT